MHRIYLIFLFVASTSFLVYAQTKSPYFVRHYNTEDGLSNNWISDIIQDKEGFIWCASQYGLNRFDGQHFTAYTYRPGDTASIGANWVKSIMLSKKGQLFLGTYGKGLSQMSPNKESFSKPINFLSYAEELVSVNDLLEDDTGNIWLATNSGTFRFNRAKSAISKVFSGLIHSIEYWKNNTYLLATREGLVVIENDSSYHFPLFENQDVTKAFVLQRDKLLVFANAKLYLLQNRNGHWQKEQLLEQVAYHPSNLYWPFIFKDNKGWIWVNAGKSIWRFSSDLKKKEEYDLESLLNVASHEELTAHCIFQDREDNLWIGTNIGLFQLVPPKHFRNSVLQELGISFASVREVIEFNGKIWLATFENLYCWPKNKLIPPQKIFKGRLNALHGGSDGFVYSMEMIDGVAVLLKINPISFEIKKLPLKELPNSDGACWRIVEDRKQRLWIAKWDYLICYDLKDKVAFSLEITKNRNPIAPDIIELFMGKDDNLWLGSISKGLVRISNVSQLKKGTQLECEHFLHDPSNPKSLSSNLVQAIHQTKDGNLWVGTDGGLNCLEPKSGNFQHFLRNEQMPDDKILAITSDEKGRVWFSTINHGISSYQPENGRFQIFTKQDGLYDDAMLLSSVFREKDGTIWMGSTSGLQSFRAEEVLFSKENKPNLVWMSISKHRIDTTIMVKFPNTGKSSKEPLLILPEDKSISFNFSALTFKQPHKTRYRFWLKRHHENWLPVQENGILTLTQLPAGNYELMVEAFSSGKNWRVTHPSIFIQVVPAWYKTQLAYFFYLMIIGSIIYALYQIQMRHKLAEKEKMHLENLAGAKSRWFNQIAHEFRTPLTVIIGALDQLRTKISAKEKKQVEKHLHQIKRQAGYLSGQVGQILEIARMKDGKLNIHLKTTDFISFQKYLLHSFSSLAEAQNMQLHFHSSEAQIVFPFDEEKWRKITSNLISNAIKYSKEEGDIYLDISLLNKEEQKTQLIFKVKDTGNGIAPNFISQIFDPFTREEVNHVEGIGLGLALTKELVELMNGTIKVESKLGKGSVFEVIIPIEITVCQNAATAEKQIILNNPSKPIILLAEDNLEVREYLEFCLQGNYDLLLAENGKKAWAICQEHIPDLVISDVVMPDWDGLQLTNAIKGNRTTNHIPVILLTAKGSQKAQLEGLKTGADAYLTKPFDREELQIRAAQIIEVRSKLHAKYQKGELRPPSENKQTDAFLQGIIEVIQTNLDNEEFSIQQLADTMLMSRVHLFRKIKSITGMTPTMFIRRIRLQKAQELLSKKELTIAEIAYQTGFKDPAYFARVFAETFGHSPSREREKNNH